MTTPPPRHQDFLQTLCDLCGPTHVLTGEGMRDITGKYHWHPLAVVRPASTQEVSAVLAACFRAGVAVVPMGGNTGLNGGTSAPEAVMVSTERLTRIRRIDPATRVVEVGAGVILSQIHDAVAEHDLVFPLTFGAQGSARVGGFLSTNAGGSNVLRYGSARALCLGLEVVLADGRVMDLMTALHKDNTGFDLRDLFIGAEGTLGIITAAVLRLMPAPKGHVTAFLSMNSLSGALALLNRLQKETGGAVEAFEFMPDFYMDRLARLRPDLMPEVNVGPVNIMVEMASTAPMMTRADDEGETPLRQVLQEALADAMEAGEVMDAIFATSEAQRRKIWAAREAAAEITLCQTPLVDSDIAVPLNAVEAFLQNMRARLLSLDPEAKEMVVAHLGDGNVHYTAYPSRDDAALLTAIRAAVAEEAVALGGSFSAEHGVGLSKRETMAALKDPVALEVMAAIKAALDPKGILNPGKVLPK